MIPPMSEPLLRSTLYFAIWDIEGELLARDDRCFLTAADNPKHPLAVYSQYGKDLVLARAHFFELLALKDAEILADFERRADTYSREETERERKQTAERAARARGSADRPSNRAARRRKSGRNSGAPGLYDER